MGEIIEDKNLRNKKFIFENRADAGRKLFGFLSDYRDSDSILLAIPSGGVPVAKELKAALYIDLDLLIVRKIQIPWNPEAGFGALNLDGYVIFNEALLTSLQLSDDMINIQIDSAKETIERRNKVFRGGADFPFLKDKTAIIVDDGLASGYTMIAAVEFVKKRNPSKIIVAVPTGALKTVKMISPLVDFLYCLNIREGFPYAVADAYKTWHDLTDKEVLSIMEEMNKHKRGF